MKCQCQISESEYGTYGYISFCEVHEKAFEILNENVVLRDTIKKCLEDLLYAAPELMGMKVGIVIERLQGVLEDAART